MSSKESPLISEYYRELNKRLHEENPYYGTSAYKFAPRVGELAQRLKARTLLDYGAGKCLLERGLADHFSNAPVIAVKNYDPCIPALADRDQLAPADLVACIDVLEHIEPERLDAVLDDIKKLTGRAAFLTVATRPAKKILADGRNAHLIQRPYSWWLQKLMARFRLLAFENHDDSQFLAVVDHAPKTSSVPAEQRNGTTG